MPPKALLLASASLTVLVYSIAYERFRRSFSVGRSRIISLLISLGFYVFSRRFLLKQKKQTNNIEGKLTTKEVAKVKHNPRSTKRAQSGEKGPANAKLMEEPVSIDGSDVPVCKNDAESISQRINTTFLDAVANVRNNKRLKVSNEKKLQMYGFFKQANVGPNKSSRPGIFDPVGGAKWDAWTACKTMSKREAKVNYIKLVSAVDPSWKNNGVLLELESLENSDGQNSSIMAASTLSSQREASNGVSGDEKLHDTYIEACCPAEYKDILEEKIGLFLERVAGNKEMPNPFWKFNFEKNGVQCFAPSDSEFPGAKGVSVLNYPLRSVFDVLIRCGDPNDTLPYRKDPDMKAIDRLEELDAQTGVQYLEYKSMWPVAGRDFTNLTHWRVMKSGVVVIIGFNIKYAPRPPIKSLVRAQTKLGGWCMEPLDGGKKTKLTYIVELDFKGSIPSFIVSRVTTQQPMQIDIINTFLKEEEDSCGGREVFLQKYSELGPLTNKGETSIKPTIEKKNEMATDDLKAGTSSNNYDKGRAPLRIPLSQRRRTSSSTSPKTPIGRRSWSEDHEHKVCQECKHDFNVFVRRHHCRYCGRILCDECSKYLINGRRACWDCLNTPDNE